MSDKKVLVFGTFDLLHPGHLNLFKEARSLGDHLTVVVARDKTVKEVKGRFPDMSESERLSHVSGSAFVDSAVLGSNSDKYKVIEEISPDVICLGYDQSAFTENLDAELKKRGVYVEIVRLKPYKEHVYKSSKLKEKN